MLILIIYSTSCGKKIDGILSSVLIKFSFSLKHGFIVNLMIIPHTHPRSPPTQKTVVTIMEFFLSQMHWNNPEMRDDYSDSSGMTLYYTPKLRPNSAVILMVGQWYLEIPPGKERHTESAVCSKEDTQRLLTGPIKIVRALNHMHYLGTIRTGPILAPA